MTATQLPAPPLIARALRGLLLCFAAPRSAAALMRSAAASFTPPPGYARIKVVRSFEELLGTPFADGVNALCWPRTLLGDFGEIVALLGVRDGIESLDQARLEALPLTAAGRIAAEVMLADQALLRARGLEPALDRIASYPRDESPGLVPTDVYSFHADSAPVQADTWLCTYHGAPSEGVRNDEAQRCVDVPETRAALRREFGPGDDADFHAYLRENCYDLHYVALPGAVPFSFGVGHLWRIAVEYPGSPVPPCVHRAPETSRSASPRLLLIS